MESVPAREVTAFVLAGGRSTRMGSDKAFVNYYGRPLLARAEDEDELSELVFDVVVEEFAEILGVDPEIIDPGYGDLD